MLTPKQENEEYLEAEEERRIIEQSSKNLPSLPYLRTRNGCPQSHSCPCSRAIVIKFWISMQSLRGVIVRRR